MRINNTINGVINKVFYFIYILCYSVSTYAGYSDIGTDARNLYLVSKSTEHFIKSISLISGMTLVFFGIKRYLDHRNNPIETPLHTPVTMLIIGICLILITFIPMQ